MVNAIYRVNFCRLSLPIKQCRQASFCFFIIRCCGAFLVGVPFLFYLCYVGCSSPSQQGFGFRRCRPRASHRPSSAQGLAVFGAGRCALAPLWDSACWRGVPRQLAPSPTAEQTAQPPAFLLFASLNLRSTLGGGFHHCQRLQPLPCWLVLVGLWAFVLSVVRLCVLCVVFVMLSYICNVLKFANVKGCFWVAGCGVA